MSMARSCGTPIEMRLYLAALLGFDRVPTCSHLSVGQVNVPIHVNFVMFFPTILLGAITGLCGAFYNRCALRAAQFRGKNIRPYRALFLLEPG